MILWRYLNIWRIKIDSAGFITWKYKSEGTWRVFRIDTYDHQNKDRFIKKKEYNNWLIFLFNNEIKKEEKYGMASTKRVKPIIK